ncbi:MAG: tripartite tricarboxylate transporter substrate binding protein [Burkholderiales bacterium]|nr:MAG: tripartite tricarboxylate transporter substrate binding protein [Burkholderiales bacterium]
MIDSIRRRAAFGVAALACAAALPVGNAMAAFPDKPVTLVVPYRAGGSTETMARVFSKALSENLGQPVVVKTRPGGGGAVGATEVAAAAPDGYTLLFAATASLLWPPMTQKVEYTLDSFVYVAQVTEYQQAIVAKADAPFNTVAELIAHSKKNPGLNYADQSAMSRAYLDFIAKTEDLKWTAIPTKGGGEMIPFLLSGKVDFAWSGGVHSRYAGKIKVLASMNAQRLAASPEAPSIKEKYGIAMPSQAVIVAPAGTPADVVDRLQSAIKAASADPAFAELVEGKLKFPVKFVGPAALKADIDETVAGLKSVVDKTR